MFLTDLMDKHQQTQLQIFHYFLEHEPTLSNHEVEKITNVSVPTLQREIETLNSQLHLYCDHASLKKTTSDRYTLVLPAEFSTSGFLHFYLEETITFQILEYIYQKKEITITKMALDFQISEASLFRQLRRINQYLEEFDLQFHNKKIIGNEWQIRIFFFQLLWRGSSQNSLKQRLVKSRVLPLIHVIQTQCSLSFSEDNYWQLALWLEIMQQRLDYREKQRHVLSLRVWEKIIADPFYQTIKNILARYLSRYALNWSEYEVIYLYLFLFLIFPDRIEEKRQTAPFVEHILTVDEKVIALLFKDAPLNENYKQQIFQTHLDIALTKGRIETGRRDRPLLSDDFPDVMNACMDIIEKELSTKISHSQWKNLDQFYGILWENTKKKSSSLLKICLKIGTSAHSEKMRSFVKQILATYPKIELSEVSNQHAVLIAEEEELSPEDQYDHLFLLSGYTSTFEAQRLRTSLEKYLSENKGSEK